MVCASFDEVFCQLKRQLCFTGKKITQSETKSKLFRGGDVSFGLAKESLLS